MNYEVVYLEEKKLSGLGARTNNHDPNMGMVIGGLWQKLHGEGIFSSLNKVNECAIGLYSDYESDYNGPYDITVGAEVLEHTLDKKMVNKVIPAGKYAKFIVRGHMKDACVDFWKDLWKIDIGRTYICDFEEYQPGHDMDNAEIHMYISIK